MKIAELVEEAFLAGYRHGVESYAVWRNGAQLVGALERPISEVMKRAPEDCRDVYRMFLEKAQHRHDGIEKPIIIEDDDDGS